MGTGAAVKAPLGDGCRVQEGCPFPFAWGNCGTHRDDASQGTSELSPDPLVMQG